MFFQNYFLFKILALVVEVLRMLISLQCSRKINDAPNLNHFCRAELC